MNEFENKKHLAKILNFLPMGFVLSLCLLGLGMYFFPAIEINHFYGYRTPLSMLNADIWQEANTYFAKIFLISVLGFSLLQIIFYFLIRKVILRILLGFSFSALVFVLPIFLTEKHLAHTFDEKGFRVHKLEK